MKIFKSIADAFSEISLKIGNLSSNNSSTGGAPDNILRDIKKHHNLVDGHYESLKKLDIPENLKLKEYDEVDPSASSSTPNRSTFKKINRKYNEHVLTLTEIDEKTKSRPSLLKMAGLFAIFAFSVILTADPSLIQYNHQYATNVAELVKQEQNKLSSSMTSVMTDGAAKIAATESANAIKPQYANIVLTRSLFQAAIASGPMATFGASLIFLLPLLTFFHCVYQRNKCNRDIKELNDKLKENDNGLEATIKKMETITKQIFEEQDYKDHKEKVAKAKTIGRGEIPKLHDEPLSSRESRRAKTRDDEYYRKEEDDPATKPVPIRRTHGPSGRVLSGSRRSRGER